MSFPLLPDRYNRENLQRVLDNPSILLREPRNIMHDLTYYPNRTIGRRRLIERYGEPIDVMEQDWDNLIILDACRYDIFSQENSLDGELQRVVSRGSHSRDFINSNFKGRNLNDTVYVSGNVKAADLSADVFHRMILTYRDEYLKDEYRSFKERYERYRPEVVSSLAKENYEEYDDKRYIVHFMQPHAPYLGSKAEALRTELREEHGLQFTAWEHREKYDAETEHTEHLISAAEEGYIDEAQLREVYIENLHYVFEYVEDLLDEIEGKTVVTADHGELFGDPTDHLYFGQQYAHKRDVYVPELRLVPWLEIEAEDRRNITEGEPVGKDSIDEEVLDQQLEALGYK